MDIEKLGKAITELQSTTGELERRKRLAKIHREEGPKLPDEHIASVMNLCAAVATAINGPEIATITIAELSRKADAAKASVTILSNVCEGRITADFEQVCTELRALAQDRLS